MVNPLESDAREVATATVVSAAPTPSFMPPPPPRLPIIKRPVAAQSATEVPASANGSQISKLVAAQSSISEAHQTPAPAQALPTNSGLDSALDLAFASALDAKPVAPGASSQPLFSVSAPTEVPAAALFSVSAPTEAQPTNPAAATANGSTSASTPIEALESAASLVAPQHAESIKPLLITDTQATLITSTPDITTTSPDQELAAVMKIAQSDASGAALTLEEDGVVIDPSLCQHCESPIRITDKFCIWCGEPRADQSMVGTVECPSCRVLITSKANFCYTCGQALGVYRRGEVRPLRELFVEEDPELFPTFEA